MVIHEQRGPITLPSVLENKGKPEPAVFAAHRLLLVCCGRV
jgi:hypothetical protein